MKQRSESASEETARRILRTGHSELGYESVIRPRGRDCGLGAVAANLDERARVMKLRGGDCELSTANSDTRV
jgi:hypothetical protein